MLVAIVVALMTAGVLLMATVGASADHGDRHGSNNGTVAKGGDDRGDDDQGGALLSSALAPSIPTDPAIHGVAPGGVPWVLARGRVDLQSDGGIRISIRGLVIPIAHGTFPAGTALPVTSVSASLYCAPDASAAAATTKTVPLAPTGNAVIVDTIALPAACLAPIVLVHPNAGATAYIAATGWSS